MAFEGHSVETADQIYGLLSERVQFAGRDAHPWDWVTRLCGAHAEAKPAVNAALVRLFEERSTGGAAGLGLDEVVTTATLCGLDGWLARLRGQLRGDLSAWSDEQVQQLADWIIGLQPTELSLAERHNLRSRGAGPEVFPTALHLLGMVDDAAAVALAEDAAVRAARKATQPDRVLRALAFLYWRASTEDLRSRLAVALRGLSPADKARLVDVHYAPRAQRTRADGAQQVEVLRLALAAEPVPETPPEAPAYVRAVARDFVLALAAGDLKAARALVAGPEQAHEADPRFLAWVEAMQDRLPGYLAENAGLSGVRDADHVQPMGPPGPGLAQLWQVRVAVDGALDPRGLQVMVIDTKGVARVGLPMRGKRS